MHDGGVVVSHLAGVSQPPAVAAAVVRAVRVAGVVTHGQTGGGADPCVQVELGGPRILSKIQKYTNYFVSMSFYLSSSCQFPTQQMCHENL